MVDSNFNNVIVATRFSRLAGPDARAVRSGAALQYEALTALAEALDLLASSLEAVHRGDSLDADRVQALHRRWAHLEHMRRPASHGASSVSADPPAADGPSTDAKFRMPI